VKDGREKRAMLQFWKMPMLRMLHLHLHKRAEKITLPEGTRALDKEIILEKHGSVDAQTCFFNF